jgi:hypothetical protein
MDKINSILTKAQTDLNFYTSLKTNFQGAIASYRLTSEEVKALQSKLSSIKPPEGTKSASYTKAQLTNPTRPDDLDA